MSKFIFTALFLLLSRFVGHAADAWKTFTDEPSGFLLAYPPQLLASASPANDGREFHTPDKEFSVAVRSHFPDAEENHSFDEMWRQELVECGDSITYKKKTRSWFVVSGVTKEGLEYYHKLYTKGRNWVSLDIQYPHSRNGKYDPWVEKIENRFVPFPANDDDRTDAPR